MRLIALGRKNWMHLDSEDSGPKVAAIMTVIGREQEPSDPDGASAGSVRFPVFRPRSRNGKRWASRRKRDSCCRKRDGNGGAVSGSSGKRDWLDANKPLET
jgi:hypothetical protein